jgi:hypothetical protein
MFPAGVNMSIARFQRILVLGTLGCVLLLCMQSCMWDERLLCPTQGSAQIAGVPCDIYQAAQTPCVAAFSTTRALYKSYAGPLYQVTRQSDMATANIGVLPDGYANAAAQDGFCTSTVCTITKLFDQSPHHNDLTAAPPGGAARGAGPGGQDLPAVADLQAVTAGGHKVYGLYTSPGVGYRNDSTVAIPVDGQPQGVYMVASGIHVSKYCCFDFGNAETNNDNGGAGHMDAINLRRDSTGDLLAGLDLENGIYPPVPVQNGIPFVTAMGANDGQQNYAVYWGNAQQECLVNTGLMSLPANGYSPMHQEGAIILGIGGDNSDQSEGTFLEGAMTAGVPSNDALTAVQTNVVSVGYAAIPNP